MSRKSINYFFRDKERVCYRIGDDLIEVPQRRAIITLRVENVVVSDNRWHNFNVTKVIINLLVFLAVTCLKP